MIHSLVSRLFIGLGKHLKKKILFTLLTLIVLPLLAFTSSSFHLISFFPVWSSHACVQQGLMGTKGVCDDL